MSKITKFNKNAQLIELSEEEKAKVAKVQREVGEQSILSCLKDLAGVFIKPVQRRRRK